MSGRNGDEGLRDELAALDEKFAGEKVETKRGVVPDGRYTGEVESVELKRARSQAPMLEWRLRIDDGAQKGEAVWYRRTITVDSLKYVKQDLTVAGLEVEQISTVAEHLPQLKGVRLGFTIRTKGERRNIYLNYRLDGGEGEREAGKVFEGGDDFEV